jgi:hypothetical protein
VELKLTVALKLTAQPARSLETDKTFFNKPSKQLAKS